MLDLQGKVVLVTGAPGGLGTAVSRAFRRAGARLVLTDRKGERLREAFPDLLAEPASAVAVPADLGDPGAVEALVGAAVRHFGRVDVVANVAGGFRGGKPVHETPVEDFEQMWNTNARSVFLVARAVAPEMIRRASGKIVNVASRSALAGDAGVAPYSASKSAVVRLTESLAAELKDHGVNVNCVLPGTIDTPANRQASPGVDFSRWVPPEALADVILFLSSDAARAIHGAAVPVYGLG